MAQTQFLLALEIQEKSYRSGHPDLAMPSVKTMHSVLSPVEKMITTVLYMDIDT